MTDHPLPTPEIFHGCPRCGGRLMVYRQPDPPWLVTVGCTHCAAHASAENERLAFDRLKPQMTTNPLTPPRRRP